MAAKIVIVGGGPTGLGAAYRLEQLGYAAYRVYERNGYLGGLSASFTDCAGFTWDIGGHVMFSHYPYFDSVFQALIGNEFQANRRECWIRMFDTWVPYPFQYNIRRLPREICCDCLVGLVKAQGGRDAGAAVTCADFMRSAFGEGIYRHFMQPYNFKVWAHGLETMNRAWIGERVAGVDVERSIRNILLEKDDVDWGPNNRFKFPLRGGTGEFYRRFAKPLGARLSLRKTLTEVDLDAKWVRFSDGEIVPYDHLISTMPVDQLIPLIRNEIPRQVRQAAASLRHSGGHMVGIGLRQPCPSTKSWMYFPESNCPFYRVTYLSNYSPNMTPDPDTHYSLLCETSYSEFKTVNPRTIVEDTVTGLVHAGLLKDRDRDDIVSAWHFDADYSYPIPTLERDRVLAQVIPYLETKNVFSRGRFGLWKYEVGNTDHALMQGVELSDRLLVGTAEVTAGLTQPEAEPVKVEPELWIPKIRGRAKAAYAFAQEVAEVAAEEMGITTKHSG